MNRGDLLKILASLEKGREALVADYCTEEPRLYRPMFLHKSNSSDMNIALDKYMFCWLAQHPSYYQDILNNENPVAAQESNPEFNIFINTYRNLCEKFVVGHSTNPGDKSYILENVVKESIDDLENLLTVSEKTDGRLERLRYQGEKSKHLFERILNKLKEGKNGVF